MIEVRKSGFLRTVPFLIAVFFVGFPAQAQYGGGRGTAEDPYLIYTAEQMNKIGLHKEDWDKSFKLMENIDLSSFDAREGTQSFNIIGTNWNTQFTGVFEGNGHTISNLTIRGENHLGLFGQVGTGAEVRNLGVVDVDITGLYDYVGGLIGYNSGNVIQCYSSGKVSGRYYVGGLVGVEIRQGSVTNSYSNSAVNGNLYIGGLIGDNGYWDTGGNVTNCYSTGEVNGIDYIGGLMGSNRGDVTGCYSTSAVCGNSWLGGLVGYNWGNVTACYSTGEVSGNSWIGGFLGFNQGSVTHCYSTGAVSGNIFVGGLVGYSSNRVTTCFWDMEISGQLTSYGGTGMTTTEMQRSATFIDWGSWDEEGNGIWTIDEGNDYPRLWWENARGHVMKPKNATSPNPIDGTIYQDTLVNLSWKPGDYALSHNVYFGENFEDVNSGAECTFQGNHTETVFIVGLTGFPYPTGLIPGMTYYWRIDEVNDNDLHSPWKGPVWSFSIPPRTAYNPDPADNAEAVDFDVKLSWTPGFDAKLHTVYFGDNFNDINNAKGGFPQGITTYTPALLELAKTYYWRVDELDGVNTYKGNVWNFITQGAVSNPNPSNSAMDVKHTPILTWTPGIYADSHQVYFGTDKEAVNNADIGSPEYKGSGNLGFERYEPEKLSLDNIYYWRIDEVNKVNPNSPWKGPVWNFTTGILLLWTILKAIMILILKTLRATGFGIHG